MICFVSVEHGAYLFVVDIEVCIIDYGPEQRILLLVTDTFINTI